MERPTPNNRTLTHQKETITQNKLNQLQKARRRSHNQTSRRRTQNQTTQRKIPQKLNRKNTNEELDRLQSTHASLQQTKNQRGKYCENSCALRQLDAAGTNRTHEPTIGHPRNSQMLKLTRRRTRQNLPIQNPTNPLKNNLGRIP